MESSGDKGYVSGSGQVEIVATGDRGKPIELSGKGLDGEDLDLADLRGKPVVVNVWGSWCAQCLAEQDDLTEASQELEGTAEFVGIDIRDPAVENAQAFVRSYAVPYPSFYSPDGKALVAFAGTLTAYTVPATVVLDSDGRIAAAIRGQLPSKQTLLDMVNDVAGASA